MGLKIEREESRGQERVANESRAKPHSPPFIGEVGRKVFVGYHKKGYPKQRTKNIA